MTEHFDVLIVGAGLSGIGAGYRLQTECAGKSYVILEGRATMGGTWDLFRYPGVRSDSDMFTLGYPFRPWKEAKAIADGSSILNYIRETASYYAIDEHIRYNQRVKAASWSYDDAMWTIEAEVDGALRTYTCSFLYMCSGYYSYQGGFTPNFPGLEKFEGRVIHPQKWPEGLDYTGKRVVVIGSGATAVTLIPAMAETAEHVTMLQRSPSYITALPAKDALADSIRKWLPEQRAHSIVRWKNVTITQLLYQLCRRAPKFATKLLQSGVKKHVGDAVAIDPHFSPAYQPWDQRLCLVPDADLFKALRRGKASIVTDQIATFTPTGIDLKSGEHLDADIVITATGLKMVAAGELDLEVGGRHLNTGDTLVYKGLMFSGVPNFAWCVGYTNASWTLRADLSSRYVCRFLNYLDQNGFDFGVPADEDLGVEKRPILDLNSGYVMRAVDFLPKQGPKSPWRLRQNYFLDSATMLFSRIDESMRFGRRRSMPVGDAAREKVSAVV
jgi:cation diffusion facilitator CzcD-associated flavoprotein CzcO